MALPRPYIQRIYTPRYGYGQQQSPIERGMAIGKEMGTSVGDILQAIQQSQQNQRLNEVANRLMNAASGPQYDPVSDVVNEQGMGDEFQSQSPEQQATSVANATAANQPMGGGVAEYNLRQQFLQNQLATQLRQAQIANQLAQATGTGRYAPKQAGAAQQAISDRMAQNQAIKNAQVQYNQALKQAYADQKANTDSIAKVYSDFDKIHGKGTAAEVYNAIQTGAGDRYRGSIVTGPDGTQHWQGDPNGPLFTLDPRAAHNAPIDKDFQVFNMDELNSYYGRIQNIQQKGSGGVLRPPLATPLMRAQPVGMPTAAPTAAPAATAPPVADTTGATDTTGTTDTTDTDTTGTDTTQANLPQPMNLADYNAIPTGSLFVDGDGLTKRKYTV